MRSYVSPPRIFGSIETRISFEQLSSGDKSRKSSKGPCSHTLTYSHLLYSTPPQRP